MRFAFRGVGPICSNLGSSLFPSIKDQASGLPPQQRGKVSRFICSTRWCEETTRACFKSIILENSSLGGLEDNLLFDFLADFRFQPVIFAGGIGQDLKNETYSGNFL